MNYELIHEFDVTPEDHIAFSSHIRAAFAENSASPGDRSYFFEPPHLRVVCRVDGEVAGHLALFLRTLRVGEINANTAAVGDVSVAKAHRRKGIALELVKRAIRIGETTGLDFLWLAGDQNIYAEAGFVAINNVVTRVSWETGALVTNDQHDLMVHDLDGWDWEEDDPVNLLGLML